MSNFTFKEPLAPRSVNSDEGTSKPVSRLPMPPQSKLVRPGTLSGLRPPTASSQLKRKPSPNEDIDPRPSSKRMKLSTDSDSSENSIPKVPPAQPVRKNTLRPGTSMSTRSSQQKSAIQRKASGIAVKPAKSTVPTAQSAKLYKPPLDMKSRLQIMEEKVSHQDHHNANLLREIELSNSRITQLETMNSQLSETVKVKDSLSSSAQVQIEELERKLRRVEEDKQEALIQHKRQREEMEYDMSVLKRQKTELEDELKVTRCKVTGLEMSLASSASTRVLLEADISAAKITLGHYEAKMRDQDIVIAGLRGELDKYVADLAAAQEKLRNEESLRRMLHNTIQELKGNIRVFGRVRPLLGEEAVGCVSNIPAHITFPNNDDRVIEIEKVNPASPNESVASVRKGSISGKYEFQFDRVFPPTSSQEEVFEEISQLVQSALDGYNVCIFAYGQTGSGKTYTMEGSGADQNRGMIPRAVEKIFSVKEGLKEKGWSYIVEVSFLEIYNETIRDLLAPSSKEDVKHEIRLLGPNTNEVYVTNLTNLSVGSIAEIRDLLKIASENRSVADTKCNERSSRSHSVFRMKITGNNEKTGESRVGLLNLVDLAGSERLKDSGSQGMRLKETQSINKSLANLSNVIISLANKEPHVPYRNSKLTHLLQNCLGGSSKMLMFVNVSPKEECFQETLNSLRFATQVNECNIGTAQKKVK